MHLRTLGIQDVTGFSFPILKNVIRYLIYKLQVKYILQIMKIYASKSKKKRNIIIN